MNAASFLILVVALGAQDKTLKERFAALEKAHLDAVAKSVERTRNESAQDPYAGARDRYLNGPIREYAPKIMALAESAPRDAVAVDAALWMLKYTAYQHDRDFVQYFRKAFAILRAHFPDERIDKTVIASIGRGLSPDSESFLRFVADKEIDSDRRAFAQLTLANYLTKRRIGSLYPKNPERDQNIAKSPLRFLLERYDQSFHDYNESADSSVLKREAKELFEKVGKEAGGRVAKKRGAREITYAELAKSGLTELMSLAVGEQAPEIEGKDADDKPFKLSDYRGKVVLLVFSGSWCAPCMALHPRERALVERLKDKPFAMLEVNTDATKEELKKSIEKKETTWRSWWDNGREGPICLQWNITGFPTLYVIDAKGIVRGESLGPVNFESIVDQALAEMK